MAPAGNTSSGCAAPAAERAAPWPTSSAASAPLSGTSATPASTPPQLRGTECSNQKNGRHVLTVTEGLYVSTKPLNSLS